MVTLYTRVTISLYVQTLNPTAPDIDTGEPHGEVRPDQHGEDPGELPFMTSTFRGVLKKQTK